MCLPFFLITLLRYLSSLFDSEKSRQAARQGGQGRTRRASTYVRQNRDRFTTAGRNWLALVQDSPHLRLLSLQTHTPTPFVNTGLDKTHPLPQSQDTAPTHTLSLSSLTQNSRYLMARSSPSPTSTPTPTPREGSFLPPPLPPPAAAAAADA